MKVSDLWKFIASDVVVIFTVKDEIIANMWLRDVDQPEMLDKEILRVWPIEKRVLGIEVTGVQDEKK